MAKFRDLKTFRETAKLTQVQLAELEGVSGDLIERLESGGECEEERVKKVFRKLNDYFYTHLRTSIPDKAVVR